MGAARALCLRRVLTATRRVTLAARRTHGGDCDDNTQMACEDAAP